MSEPSLEEALAQVLDRLTRSKTRSSLVGGLAVSIRGEVRFTRDVDIAIAVRSDAETEAVVRALRVEGYSIAALVEHGDRTRLSTVRLRAPGGAKIDLLAASSGIESEIVETATPVEIEGAGAVPVAIAEDLLALKTLSYSDARPQDGIDARSLLLANPDLDLAFVRARLDLVTERGYHRHRDLHARLDDLIRSVRR